MHYTAILPSKQISWLFEEFGWELVSITFTKHQSQRLLSYDTYTPLCTTIITDISMKSLSSVNWYPSGIQREEIWHFKISLISFQRNKKLKIVLTIDCFVSRVDSVMNSKWHFLEEPNKYSNVRNFFHTKVIQKTWRWSILSSSRD